MKPPSYPCCFQSRWFILRVDENIRNYMKGAQVWDFYLLDSRHFITIKAPWIDDLVLNSKKIRFGHYLKFFAKILFLRMLSTYMQFLFWKQGKLFFIFLLLLLNSVVSGQNDLFNFRNIFGFSIDHNIFLRTLSMPKKENGDFQPSIFKMNNFFMSHSRLHR
jgi:hypothetical protein